MSLDVVMIPGFLCDGRIFAHQIDAMQQHPKVGAISVADISCGGSIESMADAVLAAAPDRFVVIGLSLGAIVATEVAVRAQGRLAGIALLDTNLAQPDAEQLERRERWHADVAAGGLFRVVVDELIEPLTSDVAQHAPLILDMALRAGANTFVQQNEALLHRRDRRDDLAHVTVPVLVAHGDEDQLCPPHVHDELAARTSRAQLSVINGAGHLSTLDQPEAATQLLTGWLSTCDNHQQLPTGGKSNDY